MYCTVCVHCMYMHVLVFWSLQTTHGGVEQMSNVEDSAGNKDGFFCCVIHVPQTELSGSLGVANGLSCSLFTF